MISSRPQSLRTFMATNSIKPVAATSSWSPKCGDNDPEIIHDAKLQYLVEQTTSVFQSAPICDSNWLLALPDELLLLIARFVATCNWDGYDCDAMHRSATISHHLFKMRIVCRSLAGIGLTTMLERLKSTDTVDHYRTLRITGGVPLDSLYSTLTRPESNFHQFVNKVKIELLPFPRLYKRLRPLPLLHAFRRVDEQYEYAWTRQAQFAHQLLESTGQKALQTLLGLFSPNTEIDLTIPQLYHCKGLPFTAEEIMAIDDGAGQYPLDFLDTIFKNIQGTGYRRLSINLHWRSFTLPTLSANALCKDLTNLRLGVDSFSPASAKQLRNLLHSCIGLKKLSISSNKVMYDMMHSKLLDGCQSPSDLTSYHNLLLNDITRDPDIIGLQPLTFPLLEEFEYESMDMHGDPWPIVWQNSYTVVPRNAVIEFLDRHRATVRKVRLLDLYQVKLRRALCRILFWLRMHFYLTECVVTEPWRFERPDDRPGSPLIPQWRRSPTMRRLVQRYGTVHDASGRTDIGSYVMEVMPQKARLLQ